MPQYLILTADPTHRNAFRDELRYSPPAKSQTQVVSKQSAPGPLQNTWLQKKKTTTILLTAQYPPKMNLYCHNRVLDEMSLLEVN